MLHHVLQLSCYRHYMYSIDTTNPSDGKMEAFASKRHPRDILRRSADMAQTRDRRSKRHLLRRYSGANWEYINHRLGWSDTHGYIPDVYVNREFWDIGYTNNKVLAVCTLVGVQKAKQQYLEGEQSNGTSLSRAKRLVVPCQNRTGDLRMTPATLDHTVYETDVFARVSSGFLRKGRHELTMTD